MQGKASWFDDDRLVSGQRTPDVQRNHDLESGMPEHCRSCNAVSRRSHLGSTSRERTPVYGVVLLDLSRSMEGEKLTAARQAVQALWQQLRNGDWLSVVDFSTTSGPDAVDMKRVQRQHPYRCGGVGRLSRIGCDPPPSSVG